MDISTSLAIFAKENNYSRPEIVESPTLEIENGRHPVVEYYLDQESKSFVSNDCNMSKSKQFIITGANMCGKST